jgi:hypothetical protein
VVEISREELFRRVWETPMVKLAKEFDISDVGLAKVCRVHNIPLPPRGHWAKLLHGKASPTPKLPPSKETTVTFDARRHCDNTAEHLIDAVTPLPAWKLKSETVAVVWPTVSAARLMQDVHEALILCPAEAPEY